VIVIGFFGDMGHGGLMRWDGNNLRKYGGLPWPLPIPLLKVTRILAMTMNLFLDLLPVCQMYIFHPKAPISEG